MAASAYREALDGADPASVRRLRARLARSAVMSGDLETAQAALDGLQTDGGDDDTDILLARGKLRVLHVRLRDGTRGDARRHRSGCSPGNATGRCSISSRCRACWPTCPGTGSTGCGSSCAGRGRTRRSPTPSSTGYLCPAEYLLYGPTPYAEVIGVARDLQTTARRSGALRAAAFASALIGEAALLSGDLELAAAELREASDLHRDLGSTAGEAHSLQRLAEVRVAEGDPDAAMHLLHQALPLARSSMIANHLMQRIFGTMIIAAPDELEARAIVDRAESTLGWDEVCPFCSIMLAVPASIACARAGDLEHAHRHLAIAERSAMLWQGTAWEAGLAEAQAERGRGRGRPRHGAPSGCDRRSTSSNGPASRSTPSAAGGRWSSFDVVDSAAATVPKLPSRACRGAAARGDSRSSSTDGSSTGRASAGVIPLSSSSCSRWRPPTACTVSRSSIGCGPTRRSTSVANRLHKAAHFVRKATGPADSVVLSAAGRSRSSPTPTSRSTSRCSTDSPPRRVARATGVLDRALDVYRRRSAAVRLYEDWAFHHRQRLQLRYRELLRAVGRFERLVALDPTDEDGHVGIMRSDAPRRRSNRRAAPVRHARQVLERRARRRAEHRGVRAARPRPRIHRRPPRVRRPPTRRRPAALGHLATQRVHFCTTTDGVRLAYAASGERPAARQGRATG